MNNGNETPQGPRRPSDLQLDTHSDDSELTFDSVLHLPSPMVGPGLFSPSLMVPKHRLKPVSRVISEYKPHHGVPQGRRNVSSPLNAPKDEQFDHQLPDLEFQPTYTAHDLVGNLITYQFVDKIGQGSFSVVVLCQQSETLEKVAIKISTASETINSRSRIETSINRELNLLRQVSHPNIIKLLLSNVYVDDTNIERVLVVMPYCPGGDLFSFMANNRHSMSPSLTMAIFTNIVQGLAFLHSKDIVHRDIKLENVLLTLEQDQLLSLQSFDSPLVVLTDFGLSKHLDSPSQMLTTRCGSEDYVSPELLMGIPYDGKKNDVWALGVLLYALMEGRLPFDPIPHSANSVVSNASHKMNNSLAHRILLIDWDWISIKKPDPLWDLAIQIVESCLVRKDRRIDVDSIYNLLKGESA